MALNAPRGTADLTGEAIEYRDFIISTAKRLFCISNYSEIITPAFEYTELFDRSIGDSTDIVQKEMYTFTDKKGRSLTLRPEGTAPVVRSIIEKKLYSNNLPLKFFYIENMFRYERPQKGRMREFWQLGVEAAGTDEPVIDAEVIWLLVMIFRDIGFKRLKLVINSVGCSECRKGYINVLKEYLKPEIESLCPDCRRRYENNPLRVFDCKIKKCGKIIEDSPKIYDYICYSCRKHFDEVIKLLESVDIEYIIKPELVRGFDYYTKTVFEIISGDLESVQNALGGGGRYDRLIGQFGGPDIPAIGFAVGIDRTVVLMKKLNIRFKKPEEKSSVFIIPMSKKYNTYCFRLLNLFRESGYRTEIGYGVKSVGNQIKWAGKNGFSHAVIIGEDEIRSNSITIKDLNNYKQYNLNWAEDGGKIKKILEVQERFHD